MLNEQAGQVFAKAVRLWPDWQPNETEKEEWLKALRRISEIQTAEPAVSEAYLQKSGEYKRPKLNVIMAIAYKIQKNKAIDYRRSRPEPKPAFYLQKAGDNSKKAFYVVGSNDPDYIRRTAEKLSIKYADLYGGTWLIIRNDQPDDDPALARLRQIDGNVNARTDVPRPLTDERKQTLNIAIQTGPDCPAKTFLNERAIRIAKNEDANTTGKTLADNFIEKYNLL